MVLTLNGVRSLRRYRLVIAQKSKLRLTQEVTAALASQSRDHRLTASGFFPCSIDREYLYGYAGDGYRSPLWALCFPQWISGSCPPAPGQQNILPSGHQRPEDIAHTGYPLF